MAGNAEFTRGFTTIEADDTPWQLPFPETPEPPDPDQIEFPYDLVLLEKLAFMSDEQKIAESDAAWDRFQKNELTEQELNDFLALLFGQFEEEAPLSYDETVLAEQLGAIAEGYTPYVVA